ncbi:M23 family metallopeptidase [Desulfovibrio sp. OttesenSCG-928-O18]|nr:M23 family metallopeptidase [Desulfovibrio sp. OttesenSCG-928-O18]
MEATTVDGAVPGTYSIRKRRISLFVLSLSLLCFTGVLFLPCSGQAASAKPAVKTTVSKAAPVKSTAKKTAASSKKRRRAPYVRSLMPENERTALRDRGFSSGFGVRAISRRATRMHKGIDVPAPKNSKILAFNDGEVTFSGRKNGYGIVVIITQLDGREALYAHMNKSTVKIGDKIKRGDHIGHVGRTGRATGYHVHFELIDDGENLDPALHVWHSAELVLGPDDLDPQHIEVQTSVASPTTKRPPIH